MSIALVSCISCQKQSVQTVLLDTYYNHEINPETGRPQHYTWDDTSRWGGYSQFGELFASQGAKLSMLDAKPTASLLAGSDVYIIVDPDHEKDNPAPNHMDSEAAEAIAQWVNDVIMAEAPYGQGLVIAIADPWIYNEYIGHLLLPDNYDNATPARWLVNYLLTGEK